MNDKEFNPDEDGGLSKLIKKAKRRSMWRIVGVSLGISLLVLACAYLVNLQLLYKKADHALRDISMFKEISGPNQYGAGYRQNFGFLEGALEFQTYKLVEGIPVVWNKETYEFNAVGNFSRSLGDYSSLSLPDFSMSNEKFDYLRPYNPYNGEREMLFYLPDVSYPKVLNETSQLDDMDSRKLVELGISFNTHYTVEQINEMLPPSIHPVWYWVDTYSNKKPYLAKKMPDGTIDNPSPDPARRVYGFGVHPDYEDVTEKDFLSAVQNGINVKGKYYSEYKRIFDYLRQEKEKPAQSDVRILGVVVTGTVEHLKALKGQRYVKAAVLGAIVDKY
ncbi:hypothetical protein BK120_00025 [Paenibacillus sp. FSL A5-0031]|nr:hypothetical protein BK120_00025 [Paenibacillus sp. FSL A5-0031]